MSVETLRPDGGVLSLDPSETRTIAFDWDFNLRADITISTSTYTITVVRQSGATALTKDNPSILNAADGTVAVERTVGASRVTQVRLIATTATAGDEYELANTIVTSESPTQTKEQSIRVLIENH